MPVAMFAEILRSAFFLNFDSNYGMSSKPCEHEILYGQFISTRAEPKNNFPESHVPFMNVFIVYSRIYFARYK